MKKMLLNFADSLISKEQMSKIKDGCGYVQCSWTQCWGGDCFDKSGSCADPDPEAVAWNVGNRGGTITNISCG